MEAALNGKALPSDARLAERLCIGERTVRTVRLQVLGLNRHELKRWQGARPSPSPSDEPGERELLCATPFVGLWLLAPQIIDPGVARAAGAFWHNTSAPEIQRSCSSKS